MDMTGLAFGKPAKRPKSKPSLRDGKPWVEQRIKTVCQHCGEEFEQPKRFYQTPKKSRIPQFCSPRCWYDSRKYKRLKLCEYCGKEFTRKTVGQTLCSNTCRVSRRKQMSVSVCRICGKEIARDSRGCIRKRLCSYGCQRKWMEARNISKPCLNCGRLFANQHPVATRKAKYCSRECMVEYWHKGNHPRLRGNRIANRGGNWNVQSAAARKRDGHKCGACGVETGSAHKQHMSVDHIIPYRLAKVIGEEIGIDPNILENLISLCRSCHSKKTPIEERILKGDIVGFLQEAKRIIPIEKLLLALTVFGFYNAAGMALKKQVAARKKPGIKGSKRII